jgi:glyoxylase-like metal-dependent hydrolase (beta-lactamase superfamily II)
MGAAALSNKRLLNRDETMFEISRRDLVFSAAAAYAAFGLDKRIAFIGAAEAQTIPAQAGFKKYKVGDIEVISLYDGVWEKPHDEKFIKGASVDETKGELKAAGLPDSFVTIPFTTLAVRTGDRVVLIDSGTGSGQTGGPKAGLLLQSMAAAGIDPKSVKTILVSHFHGDHIFGLMAKDTNAQTFPEAEIVVPGDELKWWTQPVESIAEPRRGLAKRIQATFPTWKNIRVVDGEAEVAPGIRAVPTHGHTQGHTSHIISSGGKQFFATADVTNIHSLFAKHPDWQAAFDHVPDEAVATRKKVFDRAIADKMTVAGYHWGLPNAGTIAKDGNGYAFTPAG